VAVAEAQGPLAGLRLLEGLEQRLPHHHLLPSTRAALLVRAGRVAEARREYDEALALVGNDVERVFLEERRAALD
jgi:RNA polymerase sigma-70 factor, ECF subfamily